MDIPEAIARNKEWQFKHSHMAATEGFKALPLYTAIQLGIEALERQTRLFEMVSKGETIENIIQYICEPLPSETE